MRTRSVIGTFKRTCSSNKLRPQKSTEKSDEHVLTPRLNPVGIQMLSSPLQAQVFYHRPRLSDVKNENIQKSIEHLKYHQLWGKEASILPEVNFKLPKLLGSNIDEHFQLIAKEQTGKYKQAVVNLAASGLPPLPKVWDVKAGWTKYSPNNPSKQISYPDEEAMVFDVEICVSEGHYPVLAVAASSTAWYSWCSERLLKDRFSWSQRASLNDLIPLETCIGQTKPTDGSWKERVIVGHNVSFDRSRIKEQYLLGGTKARFVDTMALHIAISGLTSYQRALLMAEGTNSKRKDVQEAKNKMSGIPTKDWMRVGSLNNLRDVHQLYCGGPAIDKEVGNVFITGTLVDIRSDVQNLISYCASDVAATHAVLQKLVPQFFERFPHPVTFAGMLEMSVAYLPVNANWERYLNEAQSTYDDLEKEMKLSLMHLANEACELLHDEKYKRDTWLWDLDWSIQQIRIRKIAADKTRKKSVTSKKSGKNPQAFEEEDVKVEEAKEGFPYKLLDNDEDEKTQPSENLKKLLSTLDNLYKRRPFLAGYPNWYRELCSRPDAPEDWLPGPALISTQMQVTPKLLRLTWDGYPVHYDRKHGWGYLVPKKKNGNLTLIDGTLPREINQQSPSSPSYDTQELWERLEKGIGDPIELGKLWYAVMNARTKDKRKKERVKLTKGEGHANHHGNGPFAEVDIHDSWFYRLPHKNGPQHRVGNPLAKDFLNKIEDGTLKAHSGAQAEMVLKLGKMISYWRNAHKRIVSQIVVWLRKSELPHATVRNSNYEEDQLCGAILPQIVTAGTLTRRAVEPTWLTASNAYVDRVGSELKSIIHTPPGYHFVGADVDSQELWIAAVLGDAHFAGIHGCTALGWMTLQGKKQDGTDMHSRTANTIGITRDQAKIVNYGRIYGAGQPFAQQLLMQFNHRLSAEEAKVKAQTMFTATKGVKGFVLNKIGLDLHEAVNECDESNTKEEIVYSKGDVLQLLLKTHSAYRVQDLVAKSSWVGGTESAMFNKLEEIAQLEEPVTPVLGCRLSRALEPAYVNDNFMTSRVNWVVQSSAVDYLHLMLVCVKWLCSLYQIEARFSISIHDEVRYMVKSEDRHRAALALQVANLLTRSMFAYRLGMDDLPQCVAFFSTVDVDVVLRKEVTMDCKTPSNPHGLNKGYGIQTGEALDIHEILKITNGRLKKT